jgi:Reverse transcriptase (RNA-dependent DNA polymerase)
VDKLLEAQFFTKLNIQWGYNNVRIHSNNVKKMAFKTLLELFKLLVITFGLCNAPTTFQTFIDMQFANIIATRHVIIYLDDILIFAKTIRELTQLTHQVLQRIQDLDLFLKPTKCSFNQIIVEYLELIISEGKL